MISRNLCLPPGFSAKFPNRQSQGGGDGDGKNLRVMVKGKDFLGLCQADLSKYAGTTNVLTKLLSILQHLFFGQNIHNF